MKRAYYDTMPLNYEAVGNGSYIYRWDIKEENVQSEMMQEGEQQPVATDEKVQYSCCEVVVWAPVTANKITEAVISANIERDREMKLINDYYAANLGLFGDKDKEPAKAKIDAYTDFLQTRTNLKEQVDADCEELGIPQN